MANVFDSYEAIRKWKDGEILSHTSNLVDLNEFHDQVMNYVFEVAIQQLNKGRSPCEFCWFITGSGGRFEQGLISDQDHGIIFDSDEETHKEYFSELGKEISYGMNVAGYPYCQGYVMSSNPVWCKSLNDWKNQLYNWMELGSWETIRFLQIFYDARALKGKESLVSVLKSIYYDYQKEHMVLLKRFMQNILHVKNAIGPLGQILVEEHGEYQGSIDLKYSAFLPYVNAIRLLAIKEGVQETSTLGRIDALMQNSHYGEEFNDYKTNFELLLKYRLSLFQVNSYSETHYLNIKNFSKMEKKEIKRILKDGRRLHQHVCRIIEKG